jgi:UDP-glucose 4-epimerase
MRQTHVLVTGGAGFIGSYLVERLVLSKHKVRVLDTLESGSLNNLEHVSSKIDFVRGSILDTSLLSRACTDVEIILHQAAVSSVPRSVEEPIQSHMNGSHATLNLLEAARIKKVRRIVIASSAAVYGNCGDAPVHENYRLAPESPYAATKIASEAYAASYAKCYSMDTVILRYFNVFGPRQLVDANAGGFISSACAALVNNQPLTIYGDGNQTRDFCFVENIVNANLLALNHESALCGQAFNIGSGVSRSLNAIIDILNECSERQLIIERGRPRQGDLRHSRACVNRAIDALGFLPTRDFKKEIQQSYAWYQSQGKPSSSSLSTLPANRGV